MTDASAYVANEVLRNGLEVCIRASRPEDWDLVVTAFHALEKESIYLRFFGNKKELSEAEARQFRETDFKSRVRLLCTIVIDQQEIVIGVASYARVGESAAEVAFVVEEDYHGLGIARRLLNHLGRIATDAGISEFIAETLPNNTAMLSVFSRCGWPMKSHFSDGAVHVSLDLGGAGRRELIDE
ncbi:MAG: GNAT family N-acetyltransferase [Zoogloeaceae bacterium]|nr:GNAT family N-acetyltransferase [Zoogloeaceae bacterium]